jgi:outer membrane protein assembly factor BamD (BamD/ComL family)
MISSYKGLGLEDLAERSQEVFALNYPNVEPDIQTKSWWHVW